MLDKGGDKALLCCVVHLRKPYNTYINSDLKQGVGGLLRGDPRDRMQGVEHRFVGGPAVSSISKRDTGGDQKRPV
ncbi:hypothetical protein D3C87_2123750 [compost metagenome]